MCSLSSHSSAMTKRACALFPRHLPRLPFQRQYHVEYSFRSFLHSAHSGAFSGCRQSARAVARSGGRGTWRIARHAPRPIGLYCFLDRAGEVRKTLPRRGGVRSITNSHPDIAAAPQGRLNAGHRNIAGAPKCAAHLLYPVARAPCLLWSQRARAPSCRPHGDQIKPPL